MEVARRGHRVTVGEGDARVVVDYHAIVRPA
jgi:hypothetical protein